MKGIIIAIVVVIVGATLLFVLKEDSPEVTSTPTISASSTPVTSASPSTSVSPSVSKSATPLPTTVTVTYTDSGYSPSTVTIPVGGKVIFKNNSSSNVWTASAMHPGHTGYDGTSLSQHCPDVTGTVFDECKGEAPGTSWSFTFTKKGEWGYHNHLKSSNFGKVIVQ